MIKVNQFLTITWNSKQQQFIATGVMSNLELMMARSQDGYSWQVQAVLDQQQQPIIAGLEKLIWDNNLQQYLGVGIDLSGKYPRQIVLISNDGTHWQKYYPSATVNEPISEFFDVVKYQQSYLAIGVYGDQNQSHADIQKSVDGRNWQQIAPPEITALPAKLSAIAVKENKLVIIGKDYSWNPGHLISLLSDDGQNWQVYDTGATQNHICVVGMDWSLDQIVVVGLTDLSQQTYFAKVLTSNDGRQW